MVTKKTTAKKAPAAILARKTDPNTFQVSDSTFGITKEMTESQMLAALTTRSLMSPSTLKAYGGCGNMVELTDLSDALDKAGSDVVSGDMSRIERMLVHQAITLDAIFNNMALRSKNQDTYKGIEVLMRLALKAQAQARSTAEALALLKNPQPYIRQANMTTGPQQVNNSYAGTPSHSGIQSGAGNIQSEQNKLLEADHGNYLDTRAQGAASRVNQTVEAVG
jgi:hypothetical protein